MINYHSCFFISMAYATVSFLHGMLNTMRKIAERQDGQDEEGLN